MDNILCKITICFKIKTKWKLWHFTFLLLFLRSGVIEDSWILMPDSDFRLLISSTMKLLKNSRAHMRELR